MSIQLRRNLFSNGTISSPKCLLTLVSIQRPLLLLLPHLRMWTHPPHPKSILLPSHPHPTAPVAVPVTLAAGATADGSARKKKKKMVKHSGTSCDKTCAHADSPLHLFHMTCAYWGARIMCTTHQWVLHMDLLFKGLATIATLSTHPMAPSADPLWSWSSRRLL